MDKLERDSTGTTATMADHPTPKTNKLPTEGLAIPALFCPAEPVDLFLALWVMRDHELEADVHDPDVDELLHSFRDLLDAAFKIIGYS